MHKSCIKSRQAGRVAEGGTSDFLSKDVAHGPAHWERVSLFTLNKSGRYHLRENLRTLSIESYIVL